MNNITNILVTGAKGNVGSEVIRYLLKEDVKIFVADIDKKNLNKLFGKEVKFRKLDFYDNQTFSSALKNIDKIFLMRPPQIGDVKKYMFPFIDLIKENNIKHVVLLSIVDAIPFVPHYKIERYIEKLEIPFTHIRAGYFMQNITTTHKDSITKDKEIFIPAGEGKIHFTDVRDIAEIIVKILLSGNHTNEILRITGKEALSYKTVAEKMSKILKQKIIYINPSSRAFKKKMLEKGFPKEMVRIMRIIYFTIKRGKSENIYDDYKRIMKKNPRTIDIFIKDYAELFK